MGLGSTIKGAANTATNMATNAANTATNMATNAATGALTGTNPMAAAGIPTSIPTPTRDAPSNERKEEYAVIPPEYDDREQVTTDTYGNYMYNDFENFFWKFSQKATPSYNINTDVKFSVYLWFHGAKGNICSCPFFDKEMFKRNWEFARETHIGISSVFLADKREKPSSGLDLGEFCVDLTPFVQSVDLPQVGNNSSTEVETLLGTMKFGILSPWTSDGGQNIEMQVIDTEYSILDAIFYPWMKAIGTPKWFSPTDAEIHRSTPYPIATLEIVSPSRRYKLDEGSENVRKYVHYSLKCIGVRPSNYGQPEYNMQGRSSLTRKLTLVCDTILIDYDHEIKIYPEEEVKDKKYSNGQPGIDTKIEEKNVEGDSSSTSGPSTTDVKEEAEKAVETEKEKVDGELANMEEGKQPGVPDVPSVDATVPDVTPQTPVPEEVESTPEKPPLSEAEALEKGKEFLKNKGYDLDNPDMKKIATAALSDYLQGQGCPKPLADMVAEKAVNEAAGSEPGTDSQPGTDTQPPGGDTQPPGTDTQPPGGDDTQPPGTDTQPPGGDSPPGGDTPPSTDTQPGGEADTSITGLSARSFRRDSEDSVPISFERVDVEYSDLKKGINDRLLRLSKNDLKATNKIVEDAVKNAMSSKSTIAKLRDLVSRKSISSAVDDGNGVILETISDAGRLIDALDCISYNIEFGEDYKNLFDWLFESAPTSSVPVDVSGSLASGSAVMKRNPNVSGMICTTVNTIREAMLNTYSYLSDFKTSEPESILSLCSVVMNKRCPSNSMTEFLKKKAGIWWTGFNLTQIHNALVDFLDVSGIGKIKQVEFPFLFRFQFYTRDMCDEMKLGICEDMRQDFKTEAAERNFGDWRIRDVSTWEIVNEYNNFTGLYWCKCHLFNDSLGQGRIVVAKMNYKGEILKDNIIGEGNQFFEPVADGFSIAITKEDFNFNKWNNTSIYSSDDRYELRISGSYESFYNPDTMILESKKFLLTREWSWDNTGTKLFDTGYEHIDEFADGFFTLLTETDDGGNEVEYYVELSDDESTAPAKPSSHFRVKHISAYEAYTLFENRTPMARIESLSVKVKDLEYRLNTLYMRLDDVFSGHSIDELQDWDNDFTTTSEIDAFEAYIPLSMDYVVQYRQQSIRYSSMVVEQSKMWQIVNRIRQKISDYNYQLRNVLGEELKNDKLVPTILEKYDVLDILSNTYNSLLESEIMEEENFDRLKKEYELVKSAYENTKYTELDKYIARADETHLSQMSLSRCVKALDSIRLKEKEIVVEYEKKIADLKKYVEENKTGLEHILEVYWKYLWMSFCVSSLGVALSHNDELYKWREDRRILVERLVTLFKRHIDLIPEDIENASVDDKIVYFDWLSECVDLTEVERDDARKMAYSLRAEIKLPGLLESVARIHRRRNRLENERKQRTRLVYDVSYGFENNWVDPAEELGKTIVPMGYRSPREKAKQIKEKLADTLRGKIGKSIFEDKTTDLDTSRYEDKDVAEELRNKIGKSIFEDRVTDLDTSRYEDKNIAEELRNKIGKSIFEDKTTDLDTSRYEDKNEMEELRNKIGDVIFGEDRPLPEKEKPKRSFKEILSDVLDTYRYVSPSFSSYNKSELEDSLLFVLSRNYLRDENSAFYDRLLNTKAEIDNAKKFKEEFDSISKKEKETLDGALNRIQLIRNEIESIEKKVSSSLGNRNVDIRERNRAAKLAIMRKMELENQVEQLTNVYSDLSDHYENKTAKMLESYNSALENKRAEYSSLINKLKSDIGFEGKVRELAESINVQS